MMRGLVSLRLLLVAACTQCAGLPLLAEEPLPAVERRSPRATLGLFLEAVEGAKRGHAESLAGAIGCMDFSKVDARGANDLRKRLAWTLVEVLDRTWFIDLKQIPDVPDGPAYRRSLIRNDRSYGELVIERQPDGRWLFEAGFVARLPDILYALRGVSRLDGLTGSAGFDAGLWLQEKVPASLRKSVFFLEYWQWLGIFVIILAGIILRYVVAFLTTPLLRTVLKKDRASIMDADSSTIGKPLGMLAMSGVLWLGLKAINLPPQMYAISSTALAFFISGSVVWAFYKLTDLISAHFSAIAVTTKTKMDDLLVPLVRRALKTFIVIFGFVFVAGNAGLDISTMLAGLGLGGLAFALAAKDTIENLFGSITILMDRPFQIGDWVVINGVEGVVEEVGFRSTRIRTFYQSLVTIPNSRLVSASIDNYGARQKRRIRCTISILYSTPPALIEGFIAGIKELLALHPHSCKETFYVHLNEFSPSSLDILLYCFVATPDWGTELRERERLFLDIIRLADRLGVQFAYPTQTVHLERTARAAKHAAAAADAVSTNDVIQLGRAEASNIVSQRELIKAVK